MGGTKTCATCRHWESNGSQMVCRGWVVGVAPGQTIFLTMIHSPVTQYAATPGSFGCNLWAQTPQTERERYEAARVACIVVRAHEVASGVVTQMDDTINLLDRLLESAEKDAE